VVVAHRRRRRRLLLHQVQLLLQHLQLRLPRRRDRLPRPGRIRRQGFAQRRIRAREEQVERVVLNTLASGAAEGAGTNQ
jgi:hypothetical protein